MNSNGAVKKRNTLKCLKHQEQTAAKRITINPCGFYIFSDLLNFYYISVSNLLKCMWLFKVGKPVLLGWGVVLVFVFSFKYSLRIKLLSLSHI